MPYDLLIQNGIVIDPAQGLNRRYDVAITGGRIAALGEALPAENAHEVFDASYYYVTPGLIDLHIHIYPGVTTWGIDPDPVCLYNGVTTAVDAGSSGWATFPGFRDFIVARSQARIRAFVHISGIGLVYGPVGEMTDLSYAAPEETAETILEHPEIAVGVKVRQGRSQVGSNGVEPLRLAIQVAERIHLPVMIHIGAGLPVGEILALARPGDIITHCYHGRIDTILDERGRLRPEVIDARKDGVLFDVGHGVGSIHFDVARAAFEQHFYPDTISSDLHTLSIDGPVYNIPTTISKFLNFGMSLEDAIAKTTIAPARAIGREHEMGSLKVGMPADIAVFEMLEGEFDFYDTHGNRMRGTKKLSTIATFREGARVEIDPARRDYRRPLRKPELRIIESLREKP